jgi:hypothetical protein
VLNFLAVTAVASQAAVLHRVSWLAVILQCLQLICQVDAPTSCQ